MGWLIKPVISRRLRKQFASIHTVDALQHKIEAYIDRTIERATDGVTFSGLEHLQKGRAYLFLANHRDIVMDPASSTTRSTRPASAHRASPSATTCCNAPSSAT